MALSRPHGTCEQRLPAAADTFESLLVITDSTVQDFSVDASSTRVLLTIGGERYDLWVAEGVARLAPWWRRWFRHWEAPS
jgi:hypothetical protein